MAITEQEKEIRHLKNLVQSLENKKDELYNNLEIKKGICKYQENLINKLLNTIQKKGLDVNNDLEKGYN